MYIVNCIKKYVKHFCYTLGLCKEKHCHAIHPHFNQVTHSLYFQIWTPFEREELSKIF